MGAEALQNLQQGPFAGRGLIVIPEGSASFREDGQVVIGGRLLAEARALARAWGGLVGGPTSVLLPDGGFGGDPTAAEFTDLDLRAVEPSELPFGLFEIELDDEQSLAACLVDAGVVLVSADPTRQKVMSVCKRLGVPFVADVTEAAAEDARLGRSVWRIGARRHLSELAESCSAAAGVQCGREEGAKWAPAGTLLYRSGGPVRCCRETDLENRRDITLAGRPIRIGVMGALTSAAGADKIPEITAELRKLKVPFELDIVGDGPLRPGLKRFCQRQGATRGVMVRGGRTWPASAMDVLLCPGRDADERVVLGAMAGGVPVVTVVGGVAAKLLAAGERETGEPVGWRVFEDELAGAIARADGSRMGLVRAGEAAWRFASRHSLDSSARRRVRHLMTVSRRISARAASFVG